MEFSVLALAAAIAAPFRRCAQQIKILRVQPPAKLLCVNSVFSGFSLLNLKNGS